jgi:hypothetical protein
MSSAVKRSHAGSQKAILWFVVIALSTLCFINSLNKYDTELHTVSYGLAGQDRLRNVALVGMNESMEFVPGVSASCIDGCDQAICAVSKAPMVSRVAVIIEQSFDASCSVMETLLAAEQKRIIIGFMNEHDFFLILVNAFSLLAFFSALGLAKLPYRNAESSPWRTHSSVKVYVLAIVQFVACVMYTQTFIKRNLATMWTDSLAQLMNGSLFTYLAFLLTTFWASETYHRYKDICEAYSATSAEEDEVELVHVGYTNDFRYNAEPDNVELVAGRDYVDFETATYYNQ